MDSNSDFFSSLSWINTTMSTSTTVLYEDRISFGEIITMLVSLIFWVIIFIGCCFGCKKMCCYLCCEIPDAYCHGCCQALKNSYLAKALYCVCKTVCNVDLEERVREHELERRGADPENVYADDPPAYDIALTMPKPTHGRTRDGPEDSAVIEIETSESTEIAQADNTQVNTQSGAEAPSTSSSQTHNQTTNQSIRSVAVLPATRAPITMVERNGRNRLLFRNLSVPGTVGEQQITPPVSGVITPPVWGASVRSPSLPTISESVENTQTAPSLARLPSYHSYRSYDDVTDMTSPTSGAPASHGYSNSGYISDDGLPSYEYAVEILHEQDFMV